MSHLFDTVRSIPSVSSNLLIISDDWTTSRIVQYNRSQYIHLLSLSGDGYYYAGFAAIQVTTEYILECEECEGASTST